MKPACPSHQIVIRPGGVRCFLTCSNKRAFKATSRSFRENSEPSSLVELMILDVRSQFLNRDVELTLPQRVDDALVSLYPPGPIAARHAAAKPVEEDLQQVVEGDKRF